MANVLTPAGSQNAVPPLVCMEKAVARRTDDRPAKRIVSAAGWREDLMYALREEDDILENQTGRWPRYFYPRPPRGGRLPNME